MLNISISWAFINFTINLQIQKVYIVGGVLCQLSVPRSTLGFAADEEIHFTSSFRIICRLTAI